MTIGGDNYLEKQYVLGELKIIFLYFKNITKYDRNEQKRIFKKKFGRDCFR